jgi:hypothetical protein
MPDTDVTAGNVTSTEPPNISDLARRHGLSRQTVRRRLANGWQPPVPVEPAATPLATLVTDEIVEQDQPLATPPTILATPLANGRSLAIRDAARDAAVAGDRVPADTYISRLLEAPLGFPGNGPVGPIETGLSEPGRLAQADRAGRAGRIWSAAGRALVGLALVGSGAFIAYTSMRANSWFGHSLTPDPVAGEVYSHLSVAAELIACLLPTAIRFYAQEGDRWTALLGWLLMAVCLVVVFFAAGGFAVTNLNAGVEARAERQTAEIVLAQRRLDTVTSSRAAECAKRGPKCRDLEAQERDAIAALERARADVKLDADPQAQALGITAARLHVIQGGSMVTLCLFSGLFISFGAGLIWRRPAPGSCGARR